MKLAVLNHGESVEILNLDSALGTDFRECLGSDMRELTFAFPHRKNRAAFFEAFESEFPQVK